MKSSFISKPQTACSSRLLPSITVLLALAAALATPAAACDLCAIYSAAQARGDMGKGWHGSIAHQFTHYGTLQTDGVKVPNAEGQKLDSAITQFAVGYNLADNFGLQLNLPFIHREYQRTTPTVGVNETGSVTGLGDAALIANWSPWHAQTKHGIYRWTVLAGLKFPTGNSGRLQEEVDEKAPGFVASLPDSAVHGHDLTLGSGSVDGIIGSGLFASYEQFFFTASGQYALRTQGAKGYQFANDLTWSGGPGLYLVRSDDWMVSLQGNTTGEYKQRDSFQGAKGVDTAVKTVFVGPQVSVAWKSKLSADLGVDLPIVRDNTATQTVPDYRVRAAVNLRF